MLFKRDLKNNSALLYLVIFIVSIFYVNPSYGSGDQIPSFVNLNTSADTLSNIIDSKQFVLRHSSRTSKAKGESRPFDYNTNAVLVDTNPSALRELITSYSKYQKYFPSIKEVTVDHSKDGTNVTFAEELKFVIIEPSLDYTLQFRELPDGDIIFEHKYGDFELYRGRWEFFSVGQDRTLLVLTSRMDFSGIGWTADTILWAQPDLERTLPVIRAAEMIDKFKNEAQKHETTDTELRQYPSIPSFIEKSSYPNKLVELAKMGTVIFIHPPQYVSVNNRPTKLTFTTTLGYVKGPVNLAKKYLTKFEKVPGYIDQLESVKAEYTDTGASADWYFDMGFGILSVPIEYKVDYTWKHDKRLTYERISGDLNPIYGAYEWRELSDTSTLYGFSAASRLGKDAPNMVKLGRSLPRPQLFMGLSLGTVGVKNGVEWTNEKIK